jgi:hypothetical protein
VSVAGRGSRPAAGGRGWALLGATRDYGRRVREIVGDRIERERRAERLLLDAALPLNGMCFRHSDPASHVWMITAEHPTRWELWPLGSVDFSEPEPRRRAAEPAAWWPCDEGRVEDGFDPARATPRGEPPTLREVRLWARPWVEAVAGAAVVESAHGWTPEGPDGRSAYVVLLAVRPPGQRVVETAAFGPLTAVPHRGPCPVRSSALCDGRGERVRSSWVCLSCLLAAAVVGR